MKPKDDVLIIGSGVGGLSAGAYLSSKGYRVRVFERLEQIGGYVHTFTRKGWRFEASTHFLGGCSNRYLNQTLAMLGIDLPLVMHEHSIEAVLYDKSDIRHRYLLHAGEEAAYKSFLSYFPDEKREIEALFSNAKQIADETLRLKSIQRRITLSNAVDLLFACLLKKAKSGSVAKAAGRAYYSTLFKYNGRTGRDFLRDISDVHLRSVLSLYGLVFGARPETVSAHALAFALYVMLLRKTCSIRGGTSVLIDKLADRISTDGGEILLSTPVDRILIENQKAVGIRTSTGEEFRAPYVISNASAPMTFQQLIEPGSFSFPADIDEKLKAYKPSTSAFQSYLALPFNIEDYGYHAHSSLFSSIDDINRSDGEVHCPSASTPFILTNYAKTNPEFYPKGKSGVVIVEFDDIKRWKNLSDDDYKRQKKKTEKYILKKAQSITHIPFDKAETVFSGTPKTMAHYSGDENGSIVGAECSLAQSGANRFDYETPIPGLFLVGSDSIPSGGISACLDSGVLAGRRLMRG